LLPLPSRRRAIWAEDQPAQDDREQHRDGGKQERVADAPGFVGLVEGVGGLFDSEGGGGLL
jgi:hypothetical protein